jgi:hypothetical protein
VVAPQAADAQVGELGEFADRQHPVILDFRPRREWDGALTNLHIA